MSADLQPATVSRRQAIGLMGGGSGALMRTPLPERDPG